MRNLLRYNLFLTLLLLVSNGHAQPLQDPTKPKLARDIVGGNTQLSEVKETLVLQSIFIKESGYLAIISGQVVKVGENAHGYAVTNITAHTVTLKQGQETKILRLYQHDIKK